LLTEGLLRQVFLALPTSFLLVLVFRQWSIRVAMALSTIFVFRTLFDLPSAFGLRHGGIFLGCLVFCHILLLTGLTWALYQRSKNRVDRSQGAASSFSPGGGG
jgi:hypothetical protein